MSAILGLIAASIVSAIIGGITSSVNQANANKTNIDLQNAANDANAVEAQKNRDFQAMMSNTAHQREVQDLEAAGLNKWLSAAGQGAPVTSTAPAQNSATSVKSIGDAGLSNLSSSLQSMAFMMALNSNHSAQGVHSGTGRTYKQILRAVEKPYQHPVIKNVGRTFKGRY